MKHRIRSHKYVTFFLILSQLGCSSVTPITARVPEPPLPAQIQARLGTVGIALVQYEPQLVAPGNVPSTIGESVLGSVEGTVLGAVEGAAKGVVTAVYICGPFVASLYGAAFCSLFFGSIGSTGGAIIGGIEGANPAKAAEELKEKTKKAVPSLNFQELLRDQVLKTARESAQRQFVSIAALDPDTQDDGPSHVDLGAKGVGSVLEIGVSSIELRPLDRESLQLALKVTVRLTNTDDGSELYATTLNYVSGDRHYSEWIANDADLFRKALDRAYRRLAVKIVDKLFLIQPP